MVMGLLHVGTGFTGVVMGCMGMPLMSDGSSDMWGCCSISRIGSQGIPMVAACAKIRKKIRKSMMKAGKCLAWFWIDGHWSLMFCVNVVVLKRDVRPQVLPI